MMMLSSLLMGLGRSPRHSECSCWIRGGNPGFKSKNDGFRAYLLDAIHVFVFVGKAKVDL